MAKAKKFSVGDRVAYSAAWLRGTGNVTGGLGELRGTVRDVQPFGAHQLAVIKWDNYHAKSDYYDDGFGRVITPNLTLVSRIGADSALNT